MLTKTEAKNLIDQLRDKEISLGRAPETWYTYENHVLGVAKVAQTIAQKIEGLNPERIYVAAMLHDISRTEEEREKRFHGILGYEKLINLDADAARSAITHMFPWNIIPPFESCSKMFFGNKADYDFVASFLKNNPRTDVDLLIQLSDTMANKDGIVTLEQRAQEFAQRHNISIPKEMIEPRYKLKAYFDDKIGGNVYDLFKAKDFDVNYQSKVQKER